MQAHARSGPNTRSEAQPGDDAAGYELELRRARDEAREALEQQTATAEILKVISSSPTDIEPVFHAILANAVRLCEASVGAVFTYDGEVLTNVAHQNASPEFAEFLARSRPRPSRETTTRRCALERRMVHTADLLNDPEYTPLEFQRRENVRTVLSVPMIRDDRLVGVITLWRREVRAFNDRQIALVQTLADQAVIAIENVRLFNETREALEQQKASSEVLAVIGSSIGDTQPVFDKILQSCGRLFAGRIVGLNLVGDDGMVRLGAFHGPGRTEFEKIFPVPLDAKYSTGRAIAERRVVHYPDVENDKDVRETTRQGCRSIGIKSVVFVPVLWEGRGLGAIFAGRDHVGSFSEKETALLRSFADQAAIAIQNSRLLNETKEALDFQKATGEILASISGSITDTRPVFDAIARNLLRVFGTRFAVVELLRDGQIELVAMHGDPGFERLAQRYPRPLDAETIGGAAMLSGKIVQCTPVIGNPGIPEDIEQLAHDFGFDSCIGAPMIREDKVVGAICTAHRTAIPFSDKQLALLRTFADQAVIAIENARLFNETKEALERQTATAEILRVISGSITDTQPVFDAIVRNCQRLFGGRAVALVMPNGAMLRSVAFASEGNVEEEDASLKPWPFDRGSAGGACILDSRVIALPDIAEAVHTYPRIKQLALDLGYRSALFVPLMREGKAIACLAILRASTGEFSDKEIALASTFADQAVIAIENVRLFNETREALEQQKALAEVLGAMSGSIADTKPVFDEILDSCQRLFRGHLVGLTLAGTDGLVRLGAYKGQNKEQMEAVYPYPLDRDSGTGQAILDRRVVQFADVSAPQSDAPRHVVNGARAVGFKSIIFAPLIAEGQAFGALWVGRRVPGPFSENETALLETFADQAVIAIRNARLFNEIQHKSHELEVANRHKSEFLANMSHELRTPLNAIIGFTRIVMRRSGEQLEPKQYENLEKILTSGQNLLALINAILDLSKVEAGRVELHPAEIELAPLLEQCLRTIEPLIKDDAVTLIKAFDAQLPRIHVDEEKLRQIVINLLSNAAKFTSRGSIHVRAHGGERFGRHCRCRHGHRHRRRQARRDLR